MMTLLIPFIELFSILFFFSSFKYGFHYIENVGKLCVYLIYVIDPTIFR